MSVSAMHVFWKERGVAVSGQRRAELAALSKVAEEIGLEHDPDGLIEDRAESCQQTVDCVASSKL